jgi:uncharacterized phage-associated protein
MGTVYDARFIANTFIEHARKQGRTLTNKYLQKLVYFAQARMLSIHAERLIHQDFEAWPLGPVVPDLYDALKQYGDAPVDQEIANIKSDPLEFRERDLIERVFKMYGSRSAEELSELTHAEDTPWQKARRRGNSRPMIPIQSIQDYHVEEWREEARNTLKEMADDRQIREYIAEGIEQIDRGEFVTANELANKLFPNATRRS